jgi:hypothetical protein
MILRSHLSSTVRRAAEEIAGSRKRIRSTTTRWIAALKCGRLPCLMRCLPQAMLDPRRNGLMLASFANAASDWVWSVGAGSVCRDPGHRGEFLSLSSEVMPMAREHDVKFLAVFLRTESGACTNIASEYAAMKIPASCAQTWQLTQLKPRSRATSETLPTSSHRVKNSAFSPAVYLRCVLRGIDHPACLIH